MNNEEKILQILTQMQADISTIKQDVQDLKVSTEANFKSTRSELVEAVEAVGHKVDKLDRAVKSVEDVTAQNAFDVQLLKRQA